MGRSSLLKVLLSSSGAVRVEGYTYFMRGGKLVVMKSKRDKQRRRTELQEASSARFTEARKMWKVYRLATAELPIWSVMARETGAVKSDALFHRVNGACFRPGEGVWTFPTFQFSTGTLEPPVVTAVRRDGWSVELEWAVEEEIAPSRAKDRVYVGYFFETLPRSPLLVEAAGTRRVDGRAVVEIPPVGQPEGTPLHLYLFFGSTANDRFSPSAYACV